MGFRPVLLLVTAVAQGGLLVAVEFGFRRGLGPETTRRIAHAVGAASVAPLPLFLQLPELIALAVLITAVLVVTRERAMLPSVHAIDRPSAGALVFPAGLLLAVLIGWHHPAAIAYAALVLALADPAAALAGTRVKEVGWTVLGGRKTLGGSVTFGVVSIAIGVLVGVASLARCPCTPRWWRRLPSTPASATSSCPGRSARASSSEPGTRLIYPTVSLEFRRLRDAAGVGSSSPVHPRIHDLRHTFAVRTLVGWYRDGADVHTRVPWLSTYLGHRDPRYTYWYLSAAPELLAHAAARLELAQVVDR